jgi:16S rRNA G966 N2-methylase RsmD
MALGGASRVHMVERDPIVGLLLSDAMRRLELVSSLDIIDENDNNNYQEITRAKNLFNTLVLHQDDSVAFSKAVRLSSSNNDGVDVDVDIPRPDVCYLDPMFPPRTKSSAVKKNMQILHGLFENKDNEEKTDRIKEEQDLLIEALMLAKKRVVVKRPVTAFPLGIEKDIDAGIKMPSYELKGSVNRFDVYVI